jgi:cytochrome c5
MKNTTLALLCCGALLSACDNSNDTDREQEASMSDRASSLANDAANLASDAADSLAQSAKESASDAMAAGEELKDAAVESTTAAVDSAKEMSSDAIEKSAEMIASIGSDDAKQGESIYTSKCIACHGAGIAGAPKLGDKAAWGVRIVKGNAVLTQNAIEGFKGTTGFMPPKGGYMALSDDEVSLAVQYMVSQVQ